MRQMGMREEEIEAALRLDDDDGDDELFEIWPDNARALRVFLVVCNLWCVGPLGGVLGLDRGQIESELRMRKIDTDAELLDDLALIEAGAAAGMNEQ